MKHIPATASKASSAMKGSLRPLAILLGVYTLVFFALAYRKYSIFANDSADTAIFVHAYWATLHGKFFWHYFLNMCFFGDHGGFILVALLPVYTVFPTVPVLLFLQSVFIALAGIPMYLIARKALQDQFAALCVTAAFLLFPTIASQHVNQIHDTQFIIVFLLFTFYFYYTEQFGWFVAFTMLSCLGKENVPLTLMMFGVYAAVQRRDWKWIVTPVAISIGAMALLFKVVMPYYRGNQPYRSFAYFGPLGDTPLQMLKTAVTEPGKVLSVLFGAQNVIFFIQLIQPVAWILPFLSLPIIFVLPDLMVNLLADNVSLKVIRWHYNLTVGAFLFVSAIFSIQKLSAWLTARFGAARYAAGFGVLLTCLTVSSWTLWLDPNDYVQPPQADALEEALAKVPADQSVLVPQTMLAHVARRWYFNTIQHWVYHEHKPEKIFDYKYVIIDANERRPAWSVPQEVIKAYASNPGYELIMNEQNVLVFRRAGDDILQGKP